MFTVVALHILADPVLVLLFRHVSPDARKRSSFDQVDSRKMTCFDDGNEWCPADEEGDGYHIKYVGSDLSCVVGLNSFHLILIDVNS